MKLQILVPQYNETGDIIKGLLDSLVPQQNIDFSDIEVLIGNDGSETKLSASFISQYPFSVKYLEFEHEGIAATRQRLFEKATAQYVMYCDADDMFLTNIALFTIFRYAEVGFDILVCDFLEETRTKYGKPDYLIHRQDSTFIHGKVYRREFLTENHIKWYIEMPAHEDNVYNMLARAYTDNMKYCDTPIYLWRWRDNSICRSDPKYVLKTYHYVIYGSALLIVDAMNNNMLNLAKVQVCNLVYTIYYTLNQAIWLDPENEEYRNNVEVWFRRYYDRHKQLFGIVEPEVKNKVVSIVKQKAIRDGVLSEKYTFDEWIKHIEELEVEE